jgi:hypothetical protein
MLRWLRRRYSRPVIGSLPLSRGGTRCADCRGVDALEEGGAEPRPVLGSGDLVLARRDHNERRGQALQFWTRGASKPLFVLDDEREEQSRDELRECAEAAIGSLRSTMEVLSRNVPRILQVRISDIPFT